MWVRLGEICARFFVGGAGLFPLPIATGPETYRTLLVPYATAAAGCVIALKSCHHKPLLFARDETEALKAILKKLRPLLQMWGAGN